MNNRMRVGFKKLRRNTRLVNADRRARKLVTPGTLFVATWGDGATGMSTSQLELVSATIGGDTGVIQADRCRVTAIMIAVWARACAKAL